MRPRGGHIYGRFWERCSDRHLQIRATEQRLRPLRTTRSEDNYRQRTSAPEVRAASGEEKVKPIDKFELNRMIHARAQELALHGSPAGKNGHPQLSLSARSHFGVGSLSQLTTDQMRKLYDFLDEKKRLPVKGEI